MRLDEFSYDLPESLIAQVPLEDRSACRMMVVDRGSPDESPADATFRDLPGYLDPGDLIVVNRSRVVPARVFAYRKTGARVEILFTRALADDRFEAWVRPISRLKPGETLTCEAPDYRLVYLEQTGNREAVLRLIGGALDAFLERHGHVPLPPYIRRPDERGDRVDYQTVYARESGSVAAPTAGLHFDVPLLDALRRSGIAVEPLVLHVGPATFSPLDDDRVEDNRLPPERFWIPPSTIRAVATTKNAGRRIVAVGTTVTRALETAGADGWFDDPDRHRPEVVETDLFVYPGFEFRVVDRLITNFHLPRSSLLLLVSAFLGCRRTPGCYLAAVERGYRFYSYGDAMLIR